jgi:Flp pilus assembly protein TadD
MRRVLFGILAILFLGGCKPKEITPLARKQGATLASDANFAMSVRDYARAENSLDQATKACPDEPEYWMGLGIARRRLENRKGAKAAFQEALKASEAQYKRDPKNPQPVLQQVYLLALLGRVDEARTRLEKAKAKHPDSRDLRIFVENDQLNRLMADPAFKELAL